MVFNCDLADILVPCRYSPCTSCLFPSSIYGELMRLCMRPLIRFNSDVGFVGRRRLEFIIWIPFSVGGLKFVETSIRVSTGRTREVTNILRFKCLWASAKPPRKAFNITFFVELHGDNSVFNPGLAANFHCSPVDNSFDDFVVARSSTN